ncbi:hypothetical protein [Bacillus sp. Au-Bac7]|uniref:hypothetical protein n=1 Tax=Bacillus sp. Au-Bac7 TaxID=2906458 RepID=UPI001E29D2F6|nr:hypothetical protein [Bacillus sp. Au-Bac7]MCE4052040.1 hypothetical protein [Bacillus sp. Au-Bac7]
MNKIIRKLSNKYNQKAEGVATNRQNNLEKPKTHWTQICANVLMVIWYAYQIGAALVKQFFQS